MENEPKHPEKPPESDLKTIEKPLKTHEKTNPQTLGKQHQPSGTLDQQWILYILRDHRDLVQWQLRHVFQHEDPTAAGGGVRLDDPKAAPLVVDLGG